MTGSASLVRSRLVGGHPSTAVTSPTTLGLTYTAQDRAPRRAQQPLSALPAGSPSQISVSIELILAVKYVFDQYFRLASRQVYKIAFSPDTSAHQAGTAVAAAPQINQN